MTRYTGSALYIGWIDDSGTANLSGDWREFNVDDDLDTVDLSAANDGAKFNKGTLAELKSDATILFIGTPGTALMYRIRRGAEGTLIFGPLGTATGMPKGGYKAVVVKHSPDFKYDGEITIKVSWKGQGDYVYHPSIAAFA